MYDNIIQVNLPYCKFTFPYRVTQKFAFLLLYNAIPIREYLRASLYIAL